MSRDETPVVHTKRVDVEVEDCGQVHFADQRYREAPDGSVNHPVGTIIRGGRGFITLRVAPQWGTVPFTVAVADRDPGADLEGYEDIVETSFESSSGQVFLMGWHIDWHEEKVCRLPSLPTGPGTYRLRYHVRGMDEERCLVDDHYLQIWPVPRHDPVVLKSNE